MHKNNCDRILRNFFYNIKFGCLCHFCCLSSKLLRFYNKFDTFGLQKKETRFENVNFVCQKNKPTHHRINLNCWFTSFVRLSSFPECFVATLCPYYLYLLWGCLRRARCSLKLLNNHGQLWPVKARITHRLFALSGPSITFNLPFDSLVCPQPRSSSWQTM